MIADIDKRIRRALSGIRLAFRGVLTLVKSAGAVQLVQVDALAGEKLQDAELFQHYGYTSNPPAGTMAIVLPIGGKTAHGIIVATEHGNYRIKNLKSGEVAIYTDEGDSVVLKRGRVIEVTTETLRVNASVAIELNAPTITGNASGSVSFNTPQVTASAKVTAQGLLSGNGGMAIQGGTGATFNGNITQTSGNYTTVGDVAASGTSLHSHTHPETGSQTGAPS